MAERQRDREREYEREREGEGGGRQRGREGEGERERVRERGRGRALMSSCVMRAGEGGVHRRGTATTKWNQSLCASQSEGPRRQTMDRAPSCEKQLDGSEL